MSHLKHPSEIINPEWVNTIRQYTTEAEKQRSLQPQQLQLMLDQQWFKLLVPHIYGGAELSIPGLLRLIEAINWADGSVGWVFTLCSGAGWFGAFFEPSLSEKIFSNPNACIAGSGASEGCFAEKLEIGYRITGHWPYASGGLYATVLTGNCIITQNGQALKDNNGNNLILPFAFFANEITILNTWNPLGLIATASNAFEVKDLFVPEERCFNFQPEKAKFDNPLYQYPFLQFAESTLAANVSGMAIHFMDEVDVLFQAKRASNRLIQGYDIVEEKLKECRDNLDTARERMFTAAEQLWQLCIDKKTDEALLKEVSEASRSMAKIARFGVQSLYPYCGVASTNQGTMLNYIWRDVNTASQHSLLLY